MAQKREIDVFMAPDYSRGGKRSISKPVALPGQALRSEFWKSAVWRESRRHLRAAEMLFSEATQDAVSSATLRLFEPVGNPTSGEIIRRHFHAHAIADQDTNSMFAHLA